MSVSVLSIKLMKKYLTRNFRDVSSGGKQTNCYYNTTIDGKEIIKYQNEVILSKESRI